MPVLLAAAMVTSAAVAAAPAAAASAHAATTLHAPRLTVSVKDASIAANEPGFLSGNLIQVPIQIPVNVCGNSVDVIGLLNPAFGNRCATE